MSANGPDDLGERIAKAQRVQDDRIVKREETAKTGATGAAGMALRYSAELVATVLVGAAIGYGIDYFAGTSPWGLLVMMGFGVAAGFRNVLRAAKKMSAQAMEYSEGASAPEKDD